MAYNQVSAAAASLPPVSKDKEKVSPPLPVAPVPAPVDDGKVVKQMAVLVDVDVKPASSLSISPPLAFMPAGSSSNNNNKTTTTTRTTTTTTTRTTTTTTTTPPPVDAAPIQLMVCLWALLNAVVFAVTDVAIVIVNYHPCTKSTWLFRCVTLTDDAAAGELSLLLFGELLCSAAAVLAAPLHMMLATRTTTTTSPMRSRWGAVVDALAWVALAATAAMHCMEVASDRILLAAKPGDTYIFVDVVAWSFFLALDLLLAGVLLSVLCCSPRRKLGEQQGNDDGEV